MSATEARLQELGLELPPACPSRALFLPYRRVGDLLFLSGQICEWNGEPRWFGPVTTATPIGDMQRAAELCALNLLFCAREALGDLDRVRSVVRLGGFVNSEPGFRFGPSIVDGASKVFIDVFGDAGRHSRTAVCVASLPVNAAVEVDAVLDVV